MPKARIAIIGTGISGLGCAYEFKNRFDVTFFEKNSYVGGHSNTVTIDKTGFDTGFMVFNEWTYPRLTKLFRQIGVSTIPAPMSFGVQHLPQQVEFGGHTLNSFFAQRPRLFQKRFYRLLLEIKRFNREASDMLLLAESDLTVGKFIDTREYHPDLAELYLIPMASAIWSAPFELVSDFPAQTLFRFLNNHGLLGFATHHQWFTLRGGAQSYVKRIVEFSGAEVRLNTAALAIRRNSEDVTVISRDSGKLREERFSHVVLACHADQALNMIDRPTPKEKELLSCFKYSRNPAYVHTDESVMPKMKRAWAAWNYRLESVRPSIVTTVHYWMNKLQSLETPTNYFVTLDSRENPAIDPSKILRQFVYEHPLLDAKSISAQKFLWELNRRGPIYFCGSYFGYGFHEDGLASGQEVAQHILRHYVPKSKAPAAEARP